MGASFWPAEVARVVWSSAMPSSLLTVARAKPVTVKLRLLAGMRLYTYSSAVLPALGC